MKKINKYKLEITVLVSGAIVMIFELVGSRILGPYLGDSIFTWTSLIGVIMGSLSWGYYWGGKKADEKADMDSLSFIIFCAASFIALTAILKGVLLLFLTNKIVDLRIVSVIGSIILFAPANILLGMVSPYVVKLKLKNLDVSGETVGNLYALSAVGSIVGTFLAGFYLIPNFGTNKILVILVIITILLSLLLSVKKNFKVRIFYLIISLMILNSLNYIAKIVAENGFIDIDTAYSRVWIHDTIDEKTNKAVRYLLINRMGSSGIFLDQSDLLSEYTKYYHLVKYFNPNFKKTLMLGGAGYSYPSDFLVKYPQSSIDVVEIDPGITELARKYFRLKDNTRLNIYHQDARVYLNKNKKKYDAIFGDAFGSYHSIPYQLTTKEVVLEKYNNLSDDGVVILNIIGSISGEKGKFLRAEYTTYKNIFSQVYLFPVQNPENGDVLQNVMLIALKSNKVPSFSSDDNDLNQYLGHLWKEPIPNDMPILTDDYAPVDYYSFKSD